jgi:tRNA G46 methylase TrmB
MQFAKVQINFCLKINNIKKDAASPFYRGMAYMAFSRSEHITIIGQICLELLNNVNPFALQYWNRKVSEWSNRNSKDKTFVYRDAIHAQNDFCAQSFKEIRQQIQKNNKRSISTTPLALIASAAAPAPTLSQAAEVVDSASTKKSKGVPASAPAPAPACNTSVQPAATDFVSDRAVSFPVHTSTSASASSCASASDQDYDINIDDDDTETPTVHAEPAHAPAQHHVMIRANYSGSVSQAWKLQNRDDRIRLVAELWTKTHDQVFPKLGKTYWEGGMKFREGSRGYGEASINVCLLMLEVLDDLYPMQLRKISPPFFVDIGSGLGNIVLQMSALQPDLKCSFGIELERPRAAFAMEACRVFTANASDKNVLFCQIQAQEGNCFEDACCKQALMSAGIVWINNEIFAPDDNLKLFQFLNSLVPVHCIIMSFVELLVTKRSSKTTPQSDQPYDFVVHTPRQLKNACSWFHPEISKQIFIIQRKTSNFALAKNDHMISSR